MVYPSLQFLDAFVQWHTLSFFAREYIVFPNEINQLRNQRKFLELNGFPLVLECIDGTHLPILAPPGNEDLYVNRKKLSFYQAICDCDLKFIDIVAKWTSCTHDAFIWRQSSINQRIASGNIPTVKGWFLGDSGYPLRPNFLTPIIIIRFSWNLEKILSALFLGLEK